MVAVYTSRIDYPGDDAMDVSAMTGNQVFAPLWPMVRDFKRRRMTWDEYKEDYVSLMWESYKVNRHEWDAILQRERVVLLCFCYDVTQCHRLLLARIFEKLGARYLGEIDKWSRKQVGIPWEPGATF